MIGWFAKRKKRGDMELMKLIGTFDLPTFRPVAMRVLEVIRSDKTNPRLVAAELAGDPGLSVRVLRVVNSAASGTRGEVQNLGHAIALLGLSRLESLIVGVAVKEALPHVCYRGFDPATFWRTAMLRAALAQELASILHPAIRIECFTAALLQDMAIPLLAAQRTQTYGPVLERWNAGEADLIDLEQDAFGWDHAKIGGLICRSWRLPEALEVAVGQHHDDPDEEGCPPAVALVSAVVDRESGPDEEAFIERVTSSYGLPAEVVNTLFEKAYERALEMTSVMGAG